MSLISFILFSILVCMLQWDVHLNVNAAPTLSKYFSMRASLISEELEQAMGSTNHTTALERKADLVFRIALQQAIDNHPELPGGSFLEPEIRNTVAGLPLYRFLKEVPKGVLLHAHENSFGDYMWTIKNATYSAKLYICGVPDGTRTMRFKFMDNPPHTTDCGSGQTWVSVNSWRQKISNQSKADNLIHQEMSLLTSQPAKDYPTLDIVWDAFNKAMMVSSGLLFNDEVFPAYFRQGIITNIEDNVQYVEIRFVFQDTIGCLYSSDGSLHTPEYTLQVIQDIVNDLKLEYPNRFFGLKIIICGLRASPTPIISSTYQQFLQLRAQFPSLVAGFDLVGQEDVGRPLRDFVGIFLNQSCYNHESKIEKAEECIKRNLFFHAGETDLANSSADSNLYDAVLLNTSRIGHGYALAHHPILLERVKSQNIGIEVCPLSNQILGLLQNIRNHPLVPFVSKNLSVSINSDDPAMWDASGVTYDWLYASLALGNMSNITVIKQLAMNSIAKSAAEEEKANLYVAWDSAWQTFLETFV
eukprot:m.13445 g.13445  ORF g.13445 m.13445 type:complete len:529 (+) comp4854_c0_seq1:107-1693(+)